jgi:hypothetical protein
LLQKDGLSACAALWTVFQFLPLVQKLGGRYSGEARYSDEARYRGEARYSSELTAVI